MAKRRTRARRSVAATWTLRAVLLVALGGALGSVLRYFVGVWLTRDDFPWGTVAVNLAGSFLIAFLLFGAFQKGYLGPEGRIFLATGVLGGFTTMSSFAFEATSFLDDAEFARAVGYMGLTVVGSLGMALLGRAAAQMIP
jgi:CrcB protein